MIYLTLFFSFFRIGLFSFGGGLAMLPLIFQTVQQFGFMSSEEFSNLVALSQVTPGPVAVNAATFIGYNFAGLPGAICATLGVALPSYLLIITVIKFLDKFNENKGIEAAFAGIRPATVGLIAAASVFVGESALINMENSMLLNGSVTSAGIELTWGYIKWALGDISSGIEIIPCLVFVATVILAAKFKMSPVKIIMIMAVVGIIFCR
nr:chromate transporter [uncultured Aminipila sp.]